METERRHRRRCYRGVLGPVVLIIVGLVLLLERNGILDRRLISQWWPLLLILIGAWLLAAAVGRRDH